MSVFYKITCYAPQVEMCRTTKSNGYQKCAVWRNKRSKKEAEKVE